MSDIVPIDLGNGSILTIPMPTFARSFATLTDDEQARFFVDVAEAAKGWRSPSTQWFAVGAHLRTCECSSPGAQQIIREMADGLRHGIPG